MKKFAIMFLMNTMFLSFLLSAGSCEKEEIQNQDIGSVSIIDVKSDGTTSIDEEIVDSPFEAGRQF